MSLIRLLAIGLIGLVIVEVAVARDRKAAREAYQSALDYHRWLTEQPKDSRTLKHYNRSIFLFRKVIDHDPEGGLFHQILPARFRQLEIISLGGRGRSFRVCICGLGGPGIPVYRRLHLPLLARLQPHPDAPTSLRSHSLGSRSATGIVAVQGSPANRRRELWGSVRPASVADGSKTFFYGDHRLHMIFTAHFRIRQLLLVCPVISSA